MTKPTGRPRGRPKTKEYVTLMARVSQDLADRVKVYRSHKRQTMSDVLRDGPISCLTVKMQRPLICLTQKRNVLVGYGAHAPQRCLTRRGTCPQSRLTQKRHRLRARQSPLSCLTGIYPRLTPASTVSANSVRVLMNMGPLVSRCSRSAIGIARPVTGRSGTRKAAHSVRPSTKRRPPPARLHRCQPDAPPAQPNGSRRLSPWTS